MNDEGWVQLNGTWLPAHEARVSPLSDAFMFGYGLFETLGLVGGRVAFASAHHTRMRQSAERLGLVLKSTADEWSRDGEELARRNGLVEGVLKRVLFKDVDGASELMSTRPNPYSEEDYARGFALQTTLDARRAGAPREKALSYLGDIVARRRARAEGFDDALWIDASGEIYEGASTNVFAIIDGTVVTPPATRGLIPGIARGIVLDQVGGKERALTLAELRGADEVFVTNAVLGVMPVSRIDDLVFPLRTNGNVARLRAEFARWQREAP